MISAIESAFQMASNAFMAERRAGRDGEAMFKASCAIEDAWPEIIKPYLKRMGHDA